MRHRRDDVVARALRVLDDHGLADLTMRRLGTELGVQPSAVYHHFPSKQVLLAAVADEILARGARPLPEGAWDDRARAACHTLRDACLAWTDGAEVVATARAFGLGARAPYDELVGVLVGGGIARRAGRARRPGRCSTSCSATRPTSRPIGRPAASAPSTPTPPPTSRPTSPPASTWCWPACGPG